VLSISSFPDPSSIAQRDLHGLKPHSVNVSLRQTKEKPSDREDRNIIEEGIWRKMTSMVSLAAD